MGALNLTSTQPLQDGIARQMRKTDGQDGLARHDVM
jgi:hypothetical protein